MEYLGNFSGSSMVIKRYKASATGLSSGVIVCSAPDAGTGQMIITAATATANQMGLLLDASNGKDGTPVAYSTTQGADEAVYGVLVNPDAILRGLMVTGATGTSLTADTIASATAGGTTAVGAVNVTSPEMDQGTLWYTSGANVGKSRKILSTSSVTSTLGTPFAANAVGDTFIYAGICPGLQGITLTTSVKNFRSDIAVATGVNVTCLDLELNGTTDTYVHVTMTDMVWSQTT